MKIPALLTALALACGVASAAPPVNNTDNNRAESTRATTDAPRGDGIIDKTKRAFNRMGDKIRDTGKRVANKSDKSDKADKDSDRDGKANNAARNDTRRMGAGADAAAARKQRKDETTPTSKKAQKE